MEKLIINNMQKTRWMVYPKKTDDIIEQLLINRGIDPKNRDQFLNPDYMRDLLDPFLIKGMDRAVELIKKTIDNKEKIGIFADYDADGIPGAALFYKVLELYDAKEAEVYIPSRSEGYGLNEKGIEELYAKGCKLLVSIDLGITNRKQIEYAKKLGMKVIVTDHHEVQKKMYPKNADVVIHTHISRKYKNNDLAGGAVVYKIAQALGKKYGKPDNKELKWLLDLPAISTICDIVPLIGENRVIAKYGLLVLSKTKNVGLNSLYKYARIDKKNVDSYIVGFQIGPRINAPGRLAHGRLSYDLLVSDNEDKAMKIAKKLDDTNKKRQKSLDEVIKKAQKQIEEKNLDKEKVIVVVGKNWPQGVVGLVSSRITDKYNRPSIILSEEKGFLRGSARSIDAFHLVDNLKKADKFLLSFGGHAKAAGLSLDEKDFKNFYKKITALGRKKIKDSDLLRVIKIDAKLAVSELTLGLEKDIRKFEPFGLGNSRPVFMLKNVQVVDTRWVGKEKKHLKIKLKHKSSTKIIDGICFNAIDKFEDIRRSSTINLVFTLSENVWRGQRKLDLMIIDMKKI